jgi:SAM-dependent methyltransferase
VLVFRERSTQPEQLDFAALPAEEVAASLSDIRWVNRNLGGLRSFRKAMAPLLCGPAAPLQLLDAGCGSGDVAADLVAWGGGRIVATGLDLKPAHLRQVPKGVARVAGDVRRLPFREAAFDVVICSLFLHHFDGDAVAEVLRGLYAQARQALVVNDLRRALVPWAFGRLVFPWVFRSKVSIHDGLLSIRRSFTPAELRAAFAAAGLDDAEVEIRRVFPYRLVAIARRRAP